MIRTTIDNLLSIKPFLQQLAGMEMRARDGFIVLRMLKVLDKEYEIIEATQRKLYDNYCEKNEDGTYRTNEDGNLLLKPETISEFNEEITTFLATEIEVDCDKLSINLIEELQFSPAQLLKMEVFFDI